MPAAPAPVTQAQKSQEKFKAQAKWPKKKVSPVQVACLLALVILTASGFLRATHQQQSTKMLRVLAAAKDIPCGTKIGFMMLRYMNIPAELVTRDMVQSLDSVAEHECRTFLQAGEPIRKTSFFGNIEGLAANLNSDERAISLQLTEDELLDHSLNPDDLVDLIAISNKDGKRYAKTICQKARVLIAAGKAQTLARHVGGTSNKITLAVSPSMAEIVSEAADEGKIRLVLRGRSNHHEEVLAGAGPNELLPASVEKEAALSKEVKANELGKAAITLAPPPQPQPLPPPPAACFEEPKEALGWVVQMISGAKKEQVSVPAK